MAPFALLPSQQMDRNSSLQVCAFCCPVALPAFICQGILAAKLCGPSTLGRCIATSIWHHCTLAVKFCQADVPMCLEDMTVQHQHFLSCTDISKSDGILFGVSLHKVLRVLSNAHYHVNSSSFRIYMAIIAPMLHSLLAILSAYLPCICCTYMTAQRHLRVPVVPLNC